MGAELGCGIVCGDTGDPELRYGQNEEDVETGGVYSGFVEELRRGYMGGQMDGLHEQTDLG